MSKVNILFFSILICFGFLVLAPLTLAKTKVTYPKASPTPTPVSFVDSYALFWPMVPGKVPGDSLYFLKTLKERVQGFFIFGAPQKTDYEVFIATKRGLEASKLLDEDKKDLASKTLDQFLNKINSAFSRWNGVKSGGEIPPDTKTHIGQQLENLNTFFKYLETKNQGDIKSKLDQGLTKVQEFKNSL